MRSSLCMLFVVGILAAGTAVAGPSPSDFRFTAAVTGEFSPDVPVGVVLSREVIAAARPDFADLRLFDDQGRETPYVIHEQTEASQAPKSYVCEIVSYQETAGIEEITVNRPPGAPAFREIELVIAGKDFKKHIRVQAGETTDAMQEIANDTIFDFSSRLDLRKTTVTIPETDAPLLRVGIADEARPSAEGPAMRLRYEGLEFWTEGTGAGRFRVERILGWSGERRPMKRHFDRITIEAPNTHSDNDGNSVVDLDSRLPVAYVTLDVENPYYYRRVELLVAEEDRDEAYRVVAAGVIYKMPGMTESENTIGFNQPSRYLRLRVLNKDNPPLRIRGVEIGWVPRRLYFVPESGRSYGLYVGSDLAAPPQYELDKLMPSDYAELQRYASMTLLGLQPNPGYDPRVKPSTREATEKAVFTGLVVLVVCVLAFWAFRLMAKMPGRAQE